MGQATTRKSWSTAPSMFAGEQPPWGIVVFQIACAVLQVPLVFIARNLRANPSIPRVAVVCMALWLIAVSLYFFLARNRKTTWPLLTGLTLAMYAFWYWRGLAASSGWLVALCLTTLGIVGAMRLSKFWFTRAAILIFGSTTALVALGFAAIGISESTTANVSVLPNIRLSADGRERPDIYVLIVDGYARQDILRRDFGFDNQGFLDRLKDQGFDIVDNATSNYSGTHFSVASILSMDYVAMSDQPVNRHDLRVLGEMIGGNNPFVRSLKDLGYSYIHGSGEWWGSSCTRYADVCIPGPLFDLTTVELLSQTPLRSLLYRSSGDPGIRVALDFLDLFENWDERSREWPAGPRVGFFHLPIPHPPFYLDANCSVRVDRFGTGRVMVGSEPMEDSVLAARKAFYIEQIECSNRMVQALIDAVPADATVVVMADHGPDSRGQVVREFETWSPEAVVERFGIFLAVRDNCESVLSSALAVNTLRGVVRCLFAYDGPDLSGRFWVVPSHLRQAALTEIDGSGLGSPK